MRVQVERERLVVHGQFRTRAYPWGALSSVRLEPLRTASPFASKFRYCALTVDLRDGTNCQFEEIAVSELDRDRIAPMVRMIEDRIAPS